MKYLMIIFSVAFISTATIYTEAPAFDPAGAAVDNVIVAQAAPSETATGTVAAEPAAASAPSAEVMTPQQLVEDVKSFYSGISSYNVDFRLIQQGPAEIKKEMTETRMEKRENIYNLMYKGPADSQSGDYWLRLTAKEGINRGTVVEREQNEEGEFQYRVFKPAFPEGTVISDDDRRITDVPETRLHSFVDDLVKRVNDPDSESTLHFIPEKIILEVIYEDTFKGKPAPHKSRTFFDADTKQMLKQETRVKPRDKFHFKMLVEWYGLEINPDLEESDFTEIPDYTEE